MRINSGNIYFKSRISDFEVGPQKQLVSKDSRKTFGDVNLFDSFIIRLPDKKGNRVLSTKRLLWADENPDSKTINLHFTDIFDKHNEVVTVEPVGPNSEIYTMAEFKEIRDTLISI